METLKEQLFDLFKKLDRDEETIEVAIDRVEDLINKIKPIVIE